MKKSSKAIIISALNDQKLFYRNAVSSSLVRNNPMLSGHIDKLKNKIITIDRVIAEVEAY